MEGITKVYGSGEVAVRALAGVSLTVERGDYVAIKVPPAAARAP